MNYELFDIKEGEKPLDHLKENCGFLNIFKDIGVIGDSLSSGELESTDENGNTNYHDMYEYSWPAFLEKITGTKFHNYSRGGMSFKEYYETWADENDFWQKQQAYIVSLGNNDVFALNQEVGSASDINLDDPLKNKDTYFGYMGKVLSKLKSIQKDARIFLVSMSIDIARTNDNSIFFYTVEEMKKVCKMYNYTYLLDMTNYGPIYDEKIREKYSMGYHPNVLGYYAYGLCIGNYIDYIIRTNYKDFFEVPFVGTGLKNNLLHKTSNK